MKLDTSVVSALAAVAMAGCLPGLANASITVNSQTASPGSPSDPSITLSSIAPSDFLSISASGEVFLQDTETGPQYGVNAGGVLLTAGSFGSTGNVGDANNFGTAAGECPLASCTFGSLLATLTLPGDSLSKTVQVFLPATSGEGSASPPSTLTYSGTWGGLFGGFAPTNGGTLSFSIADSIYSDNSGSFTVTAVPEPATWLLLLGGVGLMGAALRLGRRQAPLRAT